MKKLKQTYLRSGRVIGAVLLSVMLPMAGMLTSLM